MPGILQRAIAAIKAGDKPGGQRLLAEVIHADPRNEAAWLWMAAALDSDEQRRTCLERVLAINPDNPTAQRALASLGSTQGATGSPPQPSVVSSPGASPEPAPPLAGQAHRARAALPRWSLLVAFAATAAVCATIGIAAYLALSGALGFLREQAIRGRRADA